MAKHVQIETFVASGTFTAKVTGVHTFKAIGGGGKGTNNTGGGGGGASATKSVFMNVGDTADIVIGDVTVYPGSDTTVTINSTVVCKAVKGLYRDDGGTGGQSGDCIGDVAYSGTCATR